MLQTLIDNYQADQNKTSLFQFNEWANKRKLELLPKRDQFAVGQLIHFENGYNVPMVFKIIGISEPQDNGGTLFLNWSCFWFPIRQDRVISIINQK